MMFWRTCRRYSLYCQLAWPVDVYTWTPVHLKTRGFADWQVQDSLKRYDMKAHRKLPVKSLTPGLNTVSAKKFAPLLTSLRFRSQPYTPPAPSPIGAAELPLLGGDGAEAYRVPVTISRLCAFCWAIMWGMNLGCTLVGRREGVEGDGWAYG